MSKTYRKEERRKRSRKADDTFRCRKCGWFVGSVPFGGRHRNHCPYCLHSRHVDDDTPGDRSSTCGGLMSPVGAFTRPKGEHVVVHQCLTCGFERYNRIAADDNFDLVLTLPVVQPRTRHGDLVRPYSIERADEHTA